MITLQHSVISALAVFKKSSNLHDFEVRLKEVIPWVLLPDAIRAYVGARQLSHFEEAPNSTKDVAWMEFPTSGILRKLTKELALDIIEHQFDAGKYPKCAIGEKTRIDVFDMHNYGHPMFHYLRMHLKQDCILDEILREKLVDVTDRFSDSYALRKNERIILNGDELRSEIKYFEEWGFLRLVQKFYERTGILLNQKWFERYVYETLLECYPEDMADKTYSFMKIPNNIEAKIKNYDFATNVRAFDLSGTDLVNVWDEMYARAYIESLEEI